MKVLAVIATKGGVGKSTVTLALAVEAQRRRQQVLVLDLDTQGTVFQWHDRRGNDRPAVISCLTSRLPQTLAEAEQQGFDLVILDPPGKSDAAAIGAAKAADLVLIPTGPQLFDIDALQGIKDVLHLAGDPPALVLINKAPPQGSRHVTAADIITAQYGLKVSPVVIHQRGAHADAGNVGQTAWELDPKGKAAQEVIESYNHILIALKGAGHGKEKHAGKGKRA
jgi:chromosome partitioning protein